MCCYNSHTKKKAVQIFVDAGLKDNSKTWELCSKVYVKKCFLISKYIKNLIEKQVQRPKLRADKSNSDSRQCANDVFNEQV